MKNIQKNILNFLLLALILIASPAYLQAQGTYTPADGDLSISNDGERPSNVNAIVTIGGDLTISGTIGTFPNFAALKVVQGNVTIQRITTTTLTSLTDIFPALDSIRGTLLIQENEKITDISGFAQLDSIKRNFRIFDNDVLATLSGFAALTGIGGDLEIGQTGRKSPHRKSAAYRFACL